MSKELLNIDYIAAEEAKDLVNQIPKEKLNDCENAATKILGVLTEDGIYAAFIYVFAKVKEDLRPKFVGSMKNVLNKIHGDNFISSDYLEHILSTVSAQILKDLNKTLLARLALERFLIYTRYYAKAKQQ